MKRITKSLVAAVVTVVVMLAALGAIAQPAHAAFYTYISGSTGPWLGSPSRSNCYPLGRSITSQSTNAGRAPIYSSSVQTIWMEPRLERFDFATGTWKRYLVGKWQSRTVQPGQYAPFSEQEYTNLPNGYYYRTGYFFKWYVGNYWLGEVLTFNEQAEYKQNYVPHSYPSYGDFCYV